MVLSTPREMKVPAGWPCSTGARGLTWPEYRRAQRRDVIKAILAGASAVQVASCLLENSLPYLTLLELQGWMESKDYRSLDEFRGKLSQQNIPDPFGFERAQYMKLLMAQQ